MIPETRVLQLEGSVKGGAKLRVNTSRNLATTGTQIEKLKMEIQKLRGEIDTLRVGVVTGQLPGQESAQEGSVAQSIAGIDERLNAVEEQQKTLISAIEKAGVKKSKKKSRKPIRSLKALNASFKAKHYKHIAIDAPALLRKSKSSRDKEEVLYLYAESLYKLGRLRDAALKYNEYLEGKPEEHIAHAKMRLGDCFRHMGDRDTAKIYYEELVSKHPRTAEAEKARERLDRL